MLYPQETIRNVKTDVEYSTYIPGLLILKQEINKIIDEQIKRIEDNQDIIIQIRYIQQCGKFVVEKGIKAEYIITGYFNKSEILEEVECKRKGTKKYNIILNALKEKYNSDVLNI